MDCVADTHALVWYLFASPQLSSDAKTFMDSVADSGGYIFVPAISIIEIIYLIEKGKLLPQTLSDLMNALSLHDSSFSVIDLNADIAQTVSKVPRLTVPDMPDRIIAATALSLSLPLITKDHKIQSLKSIKTIW